MLNGEATFVKVSTGTENVKQFWNALMAKEGLKGAFEDMEGSQEEGSKIPHYKNFTINIDRPMASFCPGIVPTSHKILLLSKRWQFRKETYLLCLIKGVPWT